MIINLIGGGGGASVYVKAYGTKEALLAATANENTIGIVTAAQVLDFYIQSTAPAHSVGRVYIHTGTSGNCSLNIGNNVTIYPLYARISNGTTWTSLVMYVRKGGTWVLPDLVLMENKVKVTDFTMGGSTSITVNGLDLSLTSSAANERHSGYLNVDLTDYRKLVVSGNTALTSAQSHQLRLGITDVPHTSSSWIGFENCAPASQGDFSAEFDVSGYSNSAYIQIMSVATTTVTRRVHIYDWVLKA